MIKFLKKIRQDKKKLITITVILILVIVIAVVFIVFNKPEVEYFGQEPNIKEVALDKPLDSLNQETVNQLELKDDYASFKQQDLNDQSLVSFLNNNFTFDEYKSLVALSPDDFYQAQAGSAIDLAVFVVDALSSQVVATGVLRFDYQIENGDKKEHAVAVYRDKELPKYITLGTQSEVEIYHHGWSFTELIAAEEIRLGAKIDRYAYFPVGALDLSEAKDPYEWQLVR